MIFDSVSSNYVKLVSDMGQPYENLASQCSGEFVSMAQTWEIKVNEIIVDLI